MRPWRDVRERREGFSHCQASRFGQELVLQAGYAQRAFRELERAIGAGDDIGAFYHVEAFLSAAAAVSHILWPTERQLRGEATETYERRQARRRTLAYTIGLEDLEALRERSLRDSPVHFDERLQRFVVAGHPIYADLTVSSDAGRFPPADRMRHLDPETLILSLLGETVWLHGVHAALLDLQERLDSVGWERLISPEDAAGA